MSVTIQQRGSNTREILTADRTYYVRTDGSNSNTGLVDSAGGAFLTWQKAYDTLLMLDLNSFTTTVQVKDGTYTGALSITKPVIGGSVIFQGNSGTPANVILSTTSADAIAVSGQGHYITFKDMKLQTTTAGYAIHVTLGANIVFTNTNFGVCASGALAAESGSSITCNNGVFTISGGMPTFIGSYAGRYSIRSNSVTISGTPAWSFAFIYATLSSNLYIDGNVWTGASTGTRYIIDGNSVVNTSGAGGTHLPGNAAGSVSTGAVYL